MSFYFKTCLTLKYIFSDQADQRESIKRIIFADDRAGREPGPRRNSEGSPHFMTCTGSPRFNPVDTRKRFPLRSEEEESMEEEEEEIEDTISNMFDFEDAEDFDDIVDYRPRGEVLTRIDESQNRERRTTENYPSRISHEFLQNDETSFLILDSLDEEADSDESGYVEAPPKSFLSQDDRKEEEENRPSRLESFKDQSESVVTTCRNVKIDENDSHIIKHQDSKKEEEIETQKIEKKDPLLVSNDNQRIKERERERADFRYPVSDTIKKLATASLRNSKSFEMSSNNRLKVLSNYTNSKSFDSVRNDEINIESPSLHQRKQLLAQHGVMV